jgi:hypothetical protein
MQGLRQQRLEEERQNLMAAAQAAAASSPGTVLAQQIFEEPPVYDDSHSQESSPPLAPPAISNNPDDSDDSSASGETTGIITVGDPTVVETAPVEPDEEDDLDNFGEETVSEARARVAAVRAGLHRSTVQPEISPVVQVDHLQASRLKYDFYRTDATRWRRFLRLSTWLRLSVSGVNLDSAMNSEASGLEGSQFDFNYSSMARNALDRFFDPMLSPHFTLPVHRDNEIEPYITVSFTGHFQAAQNAICNLIVALEAEGWGCPAMRPFFCQSLSEVFQLPQFAEASQRVRELYGEACRLIALSLYSDASALGNNFDDCLHPIYLQVDCGRHRAGSHFSKTRVLVGWIPSMSQCSVGEFNVSCYIHCINPV